MLLTMADMGAGSGSLGTSGAAMTLHGPPGLKAMTNALRSFVNTREMNLKARFYVTPYISCHSDGSSQVKDNDGVCVGGHVCVCV